MTKIHSESPPPPCHFCAVGEYCLRSRDNNNCALTTTSHYPHEIRENQLFPLFKELAKNQHCILNGFAASRVSYQKKSSCHSFEKFGSWRILSWLNKTVRKYRRSCISVFAKRHINFNQSVVSIPTYARTIQFVTMILPPVVITSCGLIWPPVYTAPGPLWDLINGGGSRRTFVFIHNLGPPAQKQQYRDSLDQRDTSIDSPSPLPSPFPYPSPLFNPSPSCKNEATF